MMPRLSVVVPTFRRPALLRRCVAALLGQTFPSREYEIIVVDDGRDDLTRELVHGLSRSAPPEAPAVRYLRALSGHGPASARNAGWRSAQGVLIAFTDDDTVPRPDWLAQGERALLLHDGWSALCGRVEVPPPADARPTDHHRMTEGLQSAEFATANAFVRRSALARIGGFDERFTRAWREDSDLQFRLMRDVGPVGRCDEAVVVHPVRAERWGVSLRQQRNTFFDALLYKKHPRLYRERIRRIPPWSYYLIVASTLAALPLALGGAGGAAAACALLAGALMLQLAARRLRDTTRAPAHVAEMLLTSALIPFLSVYWRLAGAWHFRVLFL